MSKSCYPALGGHLRNNQLPDVRSVVDLPQALTIDVSLALCDTDWWLGIIVSNSIIADCSGSFCARS